MFNIGTNPHLTVTHWPNGTVCQINCLRNRSRWANKRRVCGCVCRLQYSFICWLQQTECDDFIIERLSRGLCWKTSTQFIFPFCLQNINIINGFVTWTEKIFFLFPLFAPASPNSVWTLQRYGKDEAIVCALCMYSEVLKCWESECWMLNGHHHHSTMVVVRALVATTLIMCAYKFPRLRRPATFSFPFFPIVSTTRTIGG